MNSSEEDITQIIRFARKAGKIAIGRVATMETLKNRHGTLILLTRDASAKIEKEIRKFDARIDIVRLFEKESLGYILGRKEVSVCIILDGKFSERIKQLQSEND